jgi:hypothetical protein
MSSATVPNFPATPIERVCDLNSAIDTGIRATTRRGTQRNDGRYVLTRDLATYAITRSAISNFESYAAFDTIRSL